ncbi:D(2) dopamine receptor isoform X2 [Hemicordylus capensis]|nr:D(2) dopamine receptor isoform X2 [Hemicordylus capensis]XP_053126269.1 D(2) dopamine receptor isoform X2 [Hemicordylus capensis]XP_053126270.1 D(2) dopamine receptor isoform X2 [Hemicordylus capensis]XP_053126271.1 D(2) dopamine receptor isoform X2 [Hemicordylus capensis]
MDFHNLSWYEGDDGNRTFNGSNSEAKPPQYNYYAMLLTLLIFVIVFGNVLVCMAVSREKALQTTTNYLIVSLAVADLLVATLVMPWVVYLEVVGEWRFSRIHCDIFVTLDVMMCTASILNLCAISIDRYTAVAMPMLYNTRYSSKRRVTVMIAVVWVLSFAISCPLLFGLNNTKENECIIANPAFVVYSSIASFYVPFIVTLLVYVQIYIVLRKRRKRVNTKRTGATHGGLDSDTQAPLKDKCTHPEDVRLCTLIAKTNGNFSVHKGKVEAAVSHMEEIERATSTSPPEKSKYKPPVPSTNKLVLPATSNQHANSSFPSPADSPVKVEKNGHTTLNLKTAKVFEIQTMPNGKTRTSLKAMSRRKFSQQKEKKATQMLAIVLGVFIICWLPFFITHILNMHCNCNIPQAMYNAFTWLGYVNSAVNPIIYTTFNVEFRKAFMKILHC